MYVCEEMIFLNEQKQVQMVSLSSTVLVWVGVRLVKVADGREMFGRNPTQ
jgi:hypothetical protein